MIQQLKNQQGHSKIKLSKYFFIVFLVTLIIFPVTYIYAALSCSVTTQAACTGGNVTLLRMSGSTNAHAELPSQSNSNYANNVVCCSSASSIGNSCSGNFKSIARISGVTNGTAQQSSVNTYGTNVCLSSSTFGDIITTGYQNTNCSGYDTTLFSMYATDNSHVGDGSAYTGKVCATVFTPSITFDLDVATTNTNTGSPYILPLGVLTTASPSNSDNSTIKSIWVDLDTNASGGAVVTVQSTNGALKSTSTPTHTIPSSSGTMTAGVANYGLCIGSVTQGSGGPLTKVSPFDGATCTSGNSNVIGGLTGGIQNILTTSGTIDTGRSEIRVNAENSTATVAHPDYADTLIFIATGTF